MADLICETTQATIPVTAVKSIQIEKPWITRTILDAMNTHISLKCAFSPKGIKNGPKHPLNHSKSKPWILMMWEMFFAQKQEKTESPYLTILDISLV